MSYRILLASAITGLTLVVTPLAHATSDTELQALRDEIQQIKELYENRLQALEDRLKQAESAPPAADGHAAAPARVSRGNAFNPDISLILSGSYRELSENPEQYRITGFQTPSGTGPGERGLNLSESELVLSASIDPYFYGTAILALTPDDSISMEEAYIQTLALGRGLSVKAGRFYSGIGYLNERHAHTWDFVDNPLAYQAFLGTQFGQDGAQIKWLAPTDAFLEFGAELGRGEAFPGSTRNENGIGAYSLFAHTGGDIGASHSWRGGLSWLNLSPKNREYTDTNLAGAEVTNTFSGDSRLWLADFVWKYAPGGTRTAFTLQGEYFQRDEGGRLTYDTAGAAITDGYSSSQRGAYLQGVYQFLPRWRVGLRGDWLSSGSVDYAANNANLARPDYNPSRYTLLLDYSPSEFSRLRLQLARDESREDAADNQLYLQYIMSLGAHGGHKF
ncbi:MAG: porin [Gammaproteobacteria bacterium]|nr:porin [Gammaproteobacteria bacterium]